MRYRTRVLFALVWLSLTGSVHGQATTRSVAAASQPATVPASPVPASPVPGASVTDGRVTVDGQVLTYRATAGRMTLPDDAGKPRAEMFFVAYDRTPAGDNPATRPVTFVFNGGPGAAAIWLHLGAVGPRRVRLADDAGNPPAPPYASVHNDQTWLDATDLVFIDPVGTGFSRAADGVDAKSFYNTKSDVESVGNFVRLYCTRYGRWASPKFLAGESYGTTRAAALSNHLLDAHGIGLNGIVLISTVLDFSTISPGRNNDAPYALYVPSYAAAAWYHKRLAPDLQQADLGKTLADVQEWATGPYLTALAKGAALPDEDRKAVAAQLARYTAIAPDLIDRGNLRIEPGLFEKELLGDRRQTVGRFDARITGSSLDATSPWPEYDPSLSPYLAAYSGAFNDYVRRTLKYETDLPYESLTGKVRPWDFGNEKGQGYLDVTGELREAMAKNPHLKVLVAAGYFDLATPFAQAAYTVDHLQLTPGLRKNITQTYYPGGHMMYHDHAALVQLKKDVRTFVKGAVPDGEP